MRTRGWTALAINLAPTLALAAGTEAFPTDPQQTSERTCFQTGQGWSSAGNLRSDVSIVYGIDKGLPDRIRTWRDHGYRIHVMTGVSWGSYQDYLYGRFDGINHEDEAQTERDGKKISHGGDVYYMCPGTNFGKFLCVGVQRALDAGAEAIHLEEPEFWVRGGYSEGFKREWQNYYHERWQPPNSSVDAQWRASKLKYFLYRRALQQVFDYVQDYNATAGRKVRCYVPTHSLLNYAHWRIVSPESSLARLRGCDGYIAQVWTGTSRTPNMFRGSLRERTFETAFLEYGAMQNLVRSTGRGVWYLNDPVEDNADHDWEDYRTNWESTLVASLFQPEVWQYEVAPWPERVFAGRYPKRASTKERQGIPPPYATELQTVMNALNNLNQSKVSWECGTRGIGFVVSDSLMFQRGDPSPSDPHLGHVYGIALPLLKRGMPITPVQLENVIVPGYLAPFRVLVLSYNGQKPLGPEVHPPLLSWVKTGGVLMIVDDDSDPFNSVREWWNSKDAHYSTPREQLCEGLQFSETTVPGLISAKFGKGRVAWLRISPTDVAKSVTSEQTYVSALQQAAKAAGLDWVETDHLVLRRGPFVIGAGLEESVSAKPKVLMGKFVSLFDPELKLQERVSLSPGSRQFLLDLSTTGTRSPAVLASACKMLVSGKTGNPVSYIVEGVGDTPAIVLLRSKAAPQTIQLDGKPLTSFEFSAADNLLRIHFQNEPRPRELRLHF